MLRIRVKNRSTSNFTKDSSRCCNTSRLAARIIYLPNLQIIWRRTASLFHRLFWPQVNVLLGKKDLFWQLIFLILRFDLNTFYANSRTVFLILANWSTALLASDLQKPRISSPHFSIFVIYKLHKIVCWGGRRISLTLVLDSKIVS